MSPVQPLVDDLLALLQKHADVTPTQIMIVKSAAAYLTLDDDDGRGIDRKQEDWDPRLLLTRTDWKLVPDRIELPMGIPTPGEWYTPNRLAANERFLERERAAIQAIMDSSGLTKYEAEKEYWRRRGGTFSRDEMD